MSRARTIALPTPREAPPEAAPTDPLAGKLALRIDKVADALSVSRSSVERLRRIGAFPKPDRVCGRVPLWRISTIENWLAEGNGR
jgi:predicted DNA-binding transcriptional regulator AlpA